MKNFFIKKNIGGYTIIETMIVISLFIIIVMIGMNALLNANVVSNKSQKTRSIMDNMSFAMEDISRSLRTGHAYHCITDGVTNNNNPPAFSCPGVSGGVGGGGISFKSSLGNQWVYYIDVNGNIFKSTDGGATFVQLNPNEVKINTTQSGFIVLGAEAPSSGDHQQPFVTIRLVGTINYENVVTSFSLQTSVSQRSIDI